MIASHRADEITFYEEIGVAPGASPEEIRNSFRALVRLFHPDHQTDPQLKDAAERQMRKLNRVYAVLSDPERRRRYDDVLEGEYRPTVVIGPVFRSGLRQFVGRIASVAAILLSAGLLIWLTPETIPGSQNFTSVSPSPAVDEQAALIATLRSDLKSVTQERSAVVRELARLRQVGAADAGESEREAVITMTELPSAPSPNENRETRNLTGVWYYAKSPQVQGGNGPVSDQPERIEATISEQNGTIYGKYRERFQIANRAVPPDVSFAFTGTVSAGPPFNFLLTGAAGERGEVALKVISANSLEIDWHDTEPGMRQGPDAGTAILTRRIE